MARERFHGIDVDESEDRNWLVTPVVDPITGAVSLPVASMAAAGYPTNAEAVMPRYAVNANVVSADSGVVLLSYFTARSATPRANVRVFSGTVAAAATPTLVRMGIYGVAADGALTLLHSTANDTTVFAAPLTAYTRALTTTWTPVPGARYAFATLVVSSVATPTLYGAINSIAYFTAAEPHLSRTVPGQTNLPAAIGAGSTSPGGQSHYAECTA